MIEGGQHGLQVTYYFYVFTFLFTFYQNWKRDFLRFLQCFI